MVPEEIIKKITSDERLKVPFYAKLGELLAMPEEEQQYIKVAMNLSDAEYGNLAYQMDTCLISWLYAQALNLLKLVAPLTR